MPDLTQTFGFKKPKLNEYVSPSDFNDNWDLADRELNELKNGVRDIEHGGTGVETLEALIKLLGLDIFEESDCKLTITAPDGVEVATVAPSVSAVRNIKAGTTDMAAGTSALDTGSLYFVYE